jgi:hypothetical protein
MIIQCKGEGVIGDIQRPVPERENVYSIHPSKLPGGWIFI